MSIQEEYKKIFLRKPYLQQLLLPASDPNIQIQKAKKQGYYMIFQNHILNSRYDPILEAQRVFRNLPPKENINILFLLGSGNYHLIRTLLSIRNPDQITILIELEKNIIDFHFKHNPDFMDFLKFPNCHIFSQNNLFSLWNYLSSLNPEKIQGYRIYKHTPSLNLHKDLYLEIEEKIHLIFKSNFSSLLTKFEFERLWFQNIMVNLQYLNSRIVSNRLFYYKNQLKDIPFVIVGAGPSLKYSKDILKNLQNKSFIFSTDAALKPLLKMGIIPDAVHILDAQIFSFFHCRGVDIKKILFFVDLVIHPYLIKNLQPLNWIFSSTVKYCIDHEGNAIKESIPGINITESIIGEIGQLQSGGSVSTSAFEIARFLGAKTIFLIGQDLAWTHRQLHCVDTHHYEKWYSNIHRLQSLENINENIFRKRHRNIVKGIRTPYVYGDHTLNLYRHWFEETALELNHQIQIINLTYDGALIENVEYSFPIKNFPDITHIKNQFKSRFQNASLQKYIHPEITQMIGKIIAFIHTYQNARNISEQESFYQDYQQLVNSYPELFVFSHKVNTYIKRNQNKLKQEKQIQLRYTNIMENLQKFIKFYISFSTSRIHSDVF